MTVLVTGGTGTLGRLVVARLAGDLVEGTGVGAAPDAVRTGRRAGTR